MIRGWRKDIVGLPVDLTARIARAAISRVDVRYGAFRTSKEFGPAEGLPQDFDAVSRNSRRRCSELHGPVRVKRERQFRPGSILLDDAAV